MLCFPLTGIAQQVLYPGKVRTIRSNLDLSIVIQANSPDMRTLLLDRQVDRVVHSGFATQSRNSPNYLRAYWIFAIAMCICLNPAASAADFNDAPLNCGTTLNDRSNLKDYRLRGTEALQWHYQDNKRNHVDPALLRMEEGVYSRSVIDDLHFTLARWPNHYVALQSVIKFQLGGGQADKYLPAPCYFELARQFAPDDVNVVVLYGLYWYRVGNIDDAEALWKRALQIEPDCIEAHYNLGLLYVKRFEYERALEHALHAYRAGYPLPGLREQLKKAGHWYEGADPE